MKTPLLAAAAALALIVPAASMAADRGADAAPTVSVRYDDLNLNSAAGHAALLERVRRAAEKLCGPADGLDKLTDAMRVRACVRQTTADILAKIPAANVVAGAAGHAG